ncbi:AI-2E family transporter [Flavobacterium sp. HSC-61S13]|uniref:AI-2E family transporter n=1 Tax=Flavobacterium sp. HSC-61S13 TaxID=2910963 RepID=UPI0020A0EDC2|nr:AI-2E family transporter [Flavobacterium sp. HSC-61S13]MCP1997478.1 putative PurR-regulated permease PerM [Flavobacterium sp. HSC-61S13]
MSTAKEISGGIVKAVITLVVIAGLLFLLYQVKAIFIYFVCALILSLIGAPIIRFFVKKLHFKKILAVLVTMVLFILIMLGFVFMFVPLFTTQAQNLSVLNTAQLQEDVNHLIQQVDGILAVRDLSLEKLLNLSDISSKLNFDFIPNVFNSIIGTISGLGIGIASTFFITFFFLKDQAIFQYHFKKVLPEKQEERILASLDKINNLLSRYFVGLVLQLFIVFILTLVVLLIFGVKGALMIAFLCAILNIIPYIGPLIANLLGVILTMLSYISEDFSSVIIPKALSVMVGFFIVQFIDNNINQPLIFSNSIKSHPLEIFIVILASGMLTGVFGMILAIPLYTCLKVIGKEFFPHVKLIQLLTKDI